MESTPEPRDLRERLLEAAEEEILRHGSTGLSLRALARRINVSHQAPGYVFTNRTGLFTALAETGFRLLDQRIQAARDAQPPGTSARHTLAEMGVAYVMAAQERPALFQVMYRADLVDAEDRALHDAKRDAFATLFAGVQAAVDDGWHQGEPIEQLAVLCWSSVHGVAMLDRDGGLDFLVSATPLEVLARNALRVLFDEPPIARNAAGSAGGPAITMRVVGRPREVPMRDSRPVDAGPFRAAVESGEHETLIATLAEDVRLFSPAVHAPYIGRSQVGALLRVVFEVFEDFRYTGQLVDGPDEVLRFTARVGNRDIEGVDLIRSDPQGRVTQLTVMIRPLSALLAVRDGIAARLGAQR